MDIILQKSQKISDINRSPKNYSALYWNVKCSLLNSYRSANIEASCFLAPLRIVSNHFLYILEKFSYRYILFSLVKPSLKRTLIIIRHFFIFIISYTFFGHINEKWVWCL
jgi:hypothetical protein